MHIQCLDFNTKDCRVATLHLPSRASQRFAMTGHVAGHVWREKETKQHRGSGRFAYGQSGGVTGSEDRTASSSYHSHHYSRHGRFASGRGSTGRPWQGHQRVAHLYMTGNRSKHRAKICSVTCATRTRSELHARSGLQWPKKGKLALEVINAGFNGATQRPVPLWLMEKRAQYHAYLERGWLRAGRDGLEIHCYTHARCATSEPTASAVPRAC